MSEATIPSNNDNAQGLPENLPLPNPLKTDFYQTETDVIINIFTKGRNLDDVKIDFSDKSVSISVCLADGSDYLDEINLAHQINVGASFYKIFSTKIELRLRKESCGHWAQLRAAMITDEPRPTYPTSSKSKYNWDKIEKEIEKQEREDPEMIGDPFAALFQHADEDAQRAMMKSMQESGGTCLNMNWEEVSKKRVPIEPPEGMEYKKWD